MPLLSVSMVWANFWLCNPDKQKEAESRKYVFAVSTFKCNQKDKIWHFCLFDLIRAMHSSLIYFKYLKLSSDLDYKSIDLLLPCVWHFWNEHIHLCLPDYIHTISCNSVHFKLDTDVCSKVTQVQPAVTVTNWNLSQGDKCTELSSSYNISY